MFFRNQSIRYLPDTETTLGENFGKQRWGRELFPSTVKVICAEDDAAIMKPCPQC